jgi:S-adenosylmethionine decarboxylase
MDVYGCEIIGDSDYLKSITLELVQLIKMKVLLPPIVVVGAPHLPGLSCFCIIETSHIAMHTFTDINKVSIDVYSCQDFDADKAITFFKDKFKFKRMALHKVIKRK